MSIKSVIDWTIIIGSIAFIIHCPIFKPWFGFRRPKGNNGKWGT